MRTRRCIAAVAIIATAALTPVAAAAPSDAAAYRYWSYWLGSDTGWSFASVGPAFRSPADGSIEGWRFSISGVTGNNLPGFSPDFAAVCGDTPAQEDRKRVALVVDPGSPADAVNDEPTPGAWAICIVAESRATGYDILRAAATVRAERGLICAIGGYPSRGCADIVAQPTPTPKPTPKPSPKPSRSPEPTKAPAPIASISTQPAPEPTSSPTAPATAQARSTAPTPSPSPTSPQPLTSPPVSASALPDTPLSTPSPTYSLLTTPLEEPPTEGGSGGALVAGIAVVGIAGLGGASILRMRRGA